MSKVEGFSERLQDAFYKSGMTFGELCRKTKLPFATGYSYIMYGTTPPIQNLVKLCKALNVSADYLLFGETKEV